MIRVQFPEFYTFINTEYTGNSFGERLYRWLHEESLTGTCKQCKSQTKFRNILEGFQPYCSLKCSNNDPEVKQLKENSCLKRFGVKNPSQSESIKQKKSETCLEHFGVTNNLSLKETQDQIKQTNLKKYGVEYPTQNETVLIKQRVTNLKQYGVEYVGQVKEFQEKRKNTCLQEYGVEYPIQSKLIHEKLENTNSEKYDARHYSQSEAYHRRVWCQFYNVLLNSPRLKHELIPMFSVSEYKGIEFKYKFKCLKCNNIFEDHLQDGRIPRCYVCHPKEYSSYGESEITAFIQSINPTLLIERNTKHILPSGKELDIYLPTLHIAIEFNGLFWHSEIGGHKSENYHLEKTIECETHGIRLIHIFEDEWLNKQAIVMRRLQHILGYSNKSDTIYARKCNVRPITHTVSADFLDINHLQGKDNSSIKLGLFYDNKLVSVMTFGILRLALGHNPQPDTYEMYRFCSSGNIIGAGGKLLSYFVKTYTPGKIISYADRRYSIDTAFYLKLGFQLVGKSSPGYFYTDDFLTRYHRFNFRKSELSKKLKIFDPGLSEWENMQLNGYDRIWDCGQLKYEWNRPA